MAQQEARTERIAAAIDRVDGVRPGAGPPTTKHRRMLESPYRFLRGSAQLFYADLADGALRLPAGFDTPACTTAVLGDCHMGNFGFVTEKGSHGRHIAFVPTDFDEACIGRAGWDLMRLSVSLFVGAELARGILAGRYATDAFADLDGLAAASADDAEAAVRACLDSYAETCRRVIDNPMVRRTTLDRFARRHPLRRYLKKARKRAIGGKKFERKSSLGKAAASGPNGLCFRERPNRYRRLEPALEESARAAFRPYVDDTILDIIERLGQGTGSLELPRYYLLVGREGAIGTAGLAMAQVVEAKQQRVAAPVHAFPDLDPRNSLGAAHLTVHIQRRVQREPDLLLDQMEWQGAHWLIRSRHHARVSAEPEEICLAKRHVGQRMRDYAVACGTAAALAHARGDNRSVRFETAMADALDRERDALIENARRYAEQVVADWRCFGRLMDRSGDG
ncbi:DUF2252 family protein [Sphingosinithalassobacter sp. CS137]|uniref:DUF2252 family protein n=1 Tax=Sphingosinithalassobacter sp. CS137 TaxID=2762748 RepID=UPI00165E3323|nr:DUF2252 family protein [Sphingosinithalassobacter sp. CS137]